MTWYEMADNIWHLALSAGDLLHDMSYNEWYEGHDPCAYALELNRDMTRIEELASSLRSETKGFEDMYGEPKDHYKFNLKNREIQLDILHYLLETQYPSPYGVRYGFKVQFVQLLRLLPDIRSDAIVKAVQDLLESGEVAGEIIDLHANFFDTLVVSNIIIKRRKDEAD